MSKKKVDKTDEDYIFKDNVQDHIVRDPDEFEKAADKIVEKFVKIKKKNKSDRLNPSVLDIINNYNKFDLPFLTKKDGKVYNSTFDVSNASDKLKGVFDGNETIKLTDYLVYRPLPKELLQWQNPPNVHPDSIDMEDFYADIVKHSINGVWVDGEYFNPLFMYWLNIFVFPVYMLDEDGDTTEEFETSHPFYSNIDRYIFDIIWKAMLNRHDVSLMGGRGIGKSYIIDSIIDREYRLFKKSWCLVSSTNDEMTTEAWNKVEETMGATEKLHKALKHQKIDGGDSEEFIKSGKTIILPDGSKEDIGFLSKIEKILYGIKPDKTRGKRPTIQHVEEFAAFPASHLKGNLKTCIARSRGSWWVGGSIKKCTVLYTGTGGTVENDEAEDIFTKPLAYEIEPTYDWEIPCGIFIPTHIKRSGTWEKTGCSDITAATIAVDLERKSAMSDPKKYITLCQEFPKTLKEVFMRTGSNIFNQNKLSDQRTKLEFAGEDSDIHPEKGFLEWIKNPNGHITGIKWTKSNTGDFEIHEHPYWLTTTNEEDKNKSISDLYVGGCDSIDQGTGDSAHATNNIKGSELACLIKKRVLDKNYFKESSNRYVAKYKKRSYDVRDDWDAALKLSYYYNAPINIEYTKIGIVGHFRDKGFYHMLMKRPSIARGDADPNKASNLIGTQASTPMIDHMDNKTKEYIDDYYDTIFFKDVLEHCQNYIREDRTKFDLVIAMGLCELADEDKMGITAKKDARETEQFEMFGYFTDPNTGRKTYGVIPGQNSKDDDSKESMLKREAERFNQHGGVRWVDMSDPKNPILRFDDGEE